METLAEPTEPWKVGGKKRLLNLTHNGADPIPVRLSLREAKGKLEDGLRRLPELARELESPTRAMPESDEPQWFLLLDHNDTEDEALRPHLPFGLEGLPTGEIVEVLTRAPLSEIIEPLELDPLTVADDADFLAKLGKERNLPDFIIEGLEKLY
jgi:hypothetical protein